MQKNFSEDELSTQFSLQKAHKESLNTKRDLLHIKRLENQMEKFRKISDFSMKQVVKTIGKINNGTREMLFSNMENRDVNILQNMGEMLNDTFTKLDDGKIVDTLNFYRKSAKIQRSDVKLCTEDHDHHRHCRIDKSNPW